MFWSGWPRRTGTRCRWVIGDVCMPWWKRTQKPESMSRPDNRTEKVIDRLETVAERMERVAQILASDLDQTNDEGRQLRRIVRDAQGGRPARRGDGNAGGGGGGG